MTWDYIAGFIDGEGSIVKRKRVYNLLISQTQFEVLEEIRKFIGCGLVHALGRRKSHWKDAWLYNAGGGKNTYYILENVANKLIVKRDLAIRVLHELKLRLQETEEIKNLKKDRIKRAKTLRQMKWSYRKIAKELGTDFGYVRRLIISEK
ncbi:MAG: hypothetical protein A3B25_04055 [Candidatus Ryanbacteria bacterium RIFCSPLOWO2_01_FULL_48_26]|uniref:Homing endonuclease LAGLIDADG domain-containing protein n=1 Tax=Candidatus Ryanbacteria bacterium RIFCSPLOWO2_01_FULL_48_26 TaxID=1802126 RepID=A0A1G2GRM5_9BACT|nr:MAG: hypothetical protein A3B25_04055 [Candidatus Ryanbacteria bacterium RIFCSPLOWO2_01_FULL_48_26]